MKPILADSIRTSVVASSGAGPSRVSPSAGVFHWTLAVSERTTAGVRFKSADWMTT